MNSEYVFQNEADGLWYFYDDTSMAMGPFETEEDAQEAMIRYGQHQ